MLLKTRSKTQAVESLINIWLKDTRKKCFNCGTPYDYHSFMEEVCCDAPLIGTNEQLLKKHMAILRHKKAHNANVYASTKDKNLRVQMSIPADLYQYLNKFFLDRYNEPLISNNKEATEFMNKFKKAFTVPEVI